MHDMHVVFIGLLKNENNMSIKNNIIANYISQIYVTLLNVLVVPLYIGYMGAEAFGLVGFLSLLQTWFVLFDFGLATTMLRQTACYHGGEMDALGLRQFLRALEGIFIVVGIIGTVGIILSSNFIAMNWLKVESLSIDDVTKSVMIIGIIVVLRWVSGLYRGVISGFEHFVWLSWFNCILATFRFVLIIPFFIFVSVSVYHFFLYHLAVAILEILTLVVQVYRILPSLFNVRYVKWEFGVVLTSLNFSINMAFAILAWLLLTQIDKMLLSTVLPLEEYGYFTLASLVASGVTAVVGPISSAIVPRMARFNASSDASGFLRTYRAATQLMVTTSVSISLVMIFFAEPLLTVWTGNDSLAKNISPVLWLYACGNGFQAITAMPFYLQNAKGDLKLHTIGSVIFILIFVPTIAFSIYHYGMLGAGYVWLASNALQFIFWVPVVHDKFLKDFHYKWLLHDVLMIVIPATLFCILSSKFIVFSDDRIVAGVEIIVILLITMIISVGCSSYIKNIILSLLPTLSLKKFMS